MDTVAASFLASCLLPIGGIAFGYLILKGPVEDDLHELAFYLDGAVVYRTAGRVIEIPGVDGRIEFSHGTINDRRDHYAPVTVITIPVDATVPMRFDLIGQSSSFRGSGSDLIGFLTGAAQDEDLSYRLEPAVESGSVDFGSMSRICEFSEEGKAAIETVKSLILRLSYSAFRLDSAYSLRAIFRGHVRDRETAQRMILAVSAFGAAIREQRAASAEARIATC